MPLVRYMADMTPTEKAMLTDRNWPLVSLLVFTWAAAEQPKSWDKGDIVSKNAMWSESGESGKNTDIKGNYKHIQAKMHVHLLDWLISLYEID